VTRVRSLTITVGLALAIPATAGAASLDAGKACYYNGSKARLVGTGFAPESPITFRVNDKRIKRTFTSDAAGDVRVTYTTPDIKTERKVVIRAEDPEGTSAKTTLWAARKRRVTAKPNSSTRVEEWRAVFGLYGFGNNRRAYVHYVNPDGKHVKTKRLGRLRGPCGSRVTKKRRVMPFRDPQFGIWKLQFDTRRSFSRKAKPRRVVAVTVSARRQ